MATLQVADMPEDLYRRLEDIARDERRSLSDEAVHLLAQAVQQYDLHRQRRDALAEIGQRRRKRRPASVDSLTLLREDRER